MKLNEQALRRLVRCPVVTITMFTLLPADPTDYGPGLQPGKTPPSKDA